MSGLPGPASSKALHYGDGEHRTACGVWAVFDSTSDRDAVTCVRCRGTVKYKNAWFAPAEPRLFGYRTRPTDDAVYRVVNAGHPVPEAVVALLAELFPDTIYFAEVADV